MTTNLTSVSVTIYIIPVFTFSLIHYSYLSNRQSRNAWTRTLPMFYSKVLKFKPLALFTACSEATVTKREKMNILPGQFMW